MNRYDFEYIYDENDNSHSYSIIADDYRSAFLALKNTLGLKIKAPDFRVDVFKDIPYPIVVRDIYNLEDDEYFIDKLENSSHKKLMQQGG